MQSHVARSNSGLFIVSKIIFSRQIIKRKGNHFRHDCFTATIEAQSAWKVARPKNTIYQIQAFKVISTFHLIPWPLLRRQRSGIRRAYTNQCLGISTDVLICQGGFWRKPADSQQLSADCGGGREEGKGVSYTTS
jgi:hypothetical protein